LRKKTPNEKTYLILFIHKVVIKRVGRNHSVMVVTFAIASFGLSRKCGILSLLSDKRYFPKSCGQVLSLFPLKGPKEVLLLTKK